MTRSDNLVAKITAARSLLKIKFEIFDKISGILKCNLQKIGIKNKQRMYTKYTNITCIAVLHASISNYSN